MNKQQIHDFLDNLNYESTKTYDKVAKYLSKIKEQDLNIFITVKLANGTQLSKFYTSEFKDKSINKYKIIRATCFYDNTVELVVQL